MTRTPVVWLNALWIGALIHLDWHLGRPGHDHLSFGLSYHWLLAVCTFAPVPWLLVRRWPDVAARASALVLLLGVLFGQGIEPLSEVMLFDAEPFTNAVRWRIFAEFMAAGIVVYVVSMVVALRQTRTRGLTRA
jgi:ABC-type enterochelin transport system permease subunit